MIVKIHTYFNATTTTYFVGAHYEVADGVVTKYYYAGSQRIALRVNGTLNYLLGDHLGSTSLTTDATGTVISELRYTAWGAVRYASGNTATQYQYTGQYSYAGEFGLLFYNARWVDPSLGRFAQADTVVPGGVQGYDRYAYVNNSPINYTDPTGHKPCEEWEGVCLSEDQMTDIWNSQTGNNNDEGGDDNGGDNDEQDDPTGHDYTVTDPVCLDWSWINCTEAEVANYTTQFQYPGQWPWNPVSDLGSHNVWPAEFWGIPNPLFCYTGMCDSGAIWVDIDNNNPLTITNRTQYTHIFNVGDVVRQSKQGADGNWYITTHGKGTNDGYGFIPGPALDYVNQKIGPLVFKAVDLRLVVYTTVAETGQYISSFLP